MIDSITEIQRWPTPSSVRLAVGPIQFRGVVQVPLVRATTAPTAYTQPKGAQGP
jgi:hypothetical protein